MSLRGLRIALWLGAALIAAGGLAWSRLRGAEGPGEPLGDVPPFRLLDQRGQVVTREDLRGQVWVADFVFTRCSAVCPILSARMKSLQARVGAVPDVRYVSFSVDPEHDTPEVLARYAARYAADPARWSFLTGPLPAVEEAVVRGFKIYMGARTPRSDDPSLIDIAHGEHFVLVDRRARLRGYYRSDREGLERLTRHLRALLAEPVAAAPESEALSDAR